jgi:acyl-CoA synthetase (AMP-forming)/AMP-acid ligase II
VNWHLAAPEIDYLIGNSRAKGIIVHAKLGCTRLDTLRAHAARMKACVSIGTADGFEELHAFVAGATGCPLDASLPMGRVLPYTSATTGLPKAVWRSLDGAPSAARKFIEWHLALGVALEDDNVHLCSAMLYHAAPLEGARNALEMGHTVVLTESWNPLAVLEAIERFRVTTTFLIPTMFVRLLQLPAEERERHSVRSLRFVVHGRAVCAGRETSNARLVGPRSLGGDGATEAQGTIVSPKSGLDDLAPSAKRSRVAPRDPRRRWARAADRRDWCGLRRVAPANGSSTTATSRNARVRAETSSGSAISATSTTRAIYSGGRETDLIILRREHLPSGDRERVDRAPGRRRLRRSRNRGSIVG